jgi:biopolymer transport protein ExbD
LTIFCGTILACLVSDIENQLMRLTRKYLAVVFGLLLATLILVSTLRQPRKHASGLPVQLASDTCYCDLYSRQIVVLRMSREGEIAIGSERIPDSQLASILRKIYTDRADRVLFLFPENAAPSSRVADVVELVQHMQLAKSKEPRLPQELQAPTENMNIQIRLVTPQAISAPCPKTCINWATQGLPVLPGA